jgi:hypothetical protein
MNSNNTCGFDAASRKALEKENRFHGDATAFSFLPMCWNNNQFFQSPVNAQFALFLFAWQKATRAIEEIGQRRRMIFARGEHLWN